MARAKKSKKSSELWGIIFIGTGIFILLSLISYHPNDVSYYLSPPNNPTQNLMGPVGAWLGFVLYFTFGLGAYPFSIIAILWGIVRLRKISFSKRPDIFIFAVCLMIISICGILSLIGGIAKNPILITRWKLPGLGGSIGTVVGTRFLIKYFGTVGSALIMSSIIVVSFIYLTDLKIFIAFKLLLRGIGKLLGSFFTALRSSIVWLVFLPIKAFKQWKIHSKQTAIQNRNQELTRTPVPQKASLSKKEPPKIEPKKSIFSRVPKKPVLSIPKQKPITIKAPPSGDYKLPPLDLLEPPLSIRERGAKDTLKEGARVLEETFKEFGITVKVTDARRGPVVTQYELSLAPGTKVGKITALSNDIALSMRAHSVRIIAPLPGKAAVGIEIPNLEPKFVYLKEVLETAAFQSSDAKIPLALGMDVAGKPLVSDLAEMPHLLIAGTTGSGKTVCLNAIILSLLYKASPDEIKMFLIDPKMVELSQYKNLPHLLVPVIHDPKKAALGLNWIVREMERRYELFASVGVRNIQGYNSRTNKEGCRPISEFEGHITEINYQETPPTTLPYIVLVIDELADLMLIAQADIETAIARLAQLSRAVGIHMILATQRPSVDVLTGVIKANFSTRISFQVASKIDSRTVLDSMGADVLLGKGDMLFMPPGSAKLIRAQCTLVRDSEIKTVVKYIVSQKKANFSSATAHENVFNKLQKEQAIDEDPLYRQAIDIILATQQPSTSMLQRKLRIGYNRAARIIDMLEEEGVISSLEDGKRMILIEESQFGIK